MRSCRLPHRSIRSTLALWIALVPCAVSLRAADDVCDQALAQAQYLSRNGELDKALRLCEASIPTASAESAISVALAIARERAAELDAVQQQRIQGWIDDALRDSPGDPELLLLAAELKNLQGDYEQVAKIYRGLLDERKLNDAQQAVALNRLAYLVALVEHDGDMALSMIEDAIQLAGPQSDFLDTRGIVRLAQERPWQAIRDFRRAITASASPLKLFHMADALLMWDDEYRAEATFKQALELGLKPKDIPPLERGNFAAMCDRFQIRFDE